MIYLVYTSTAAHSMSADELTELLSQCRDNNLRAGITGLLLYNNRQFIQLVEGYDTDVLHCYEKICKDPRHSDVLKLVQKPLRFRLFSEWSMAFQSGEGIVPEKLEGYSSFLNEPFSALNYGERIHEGLFLLLSFKKQMQCYGNSMGR